MPEHTPQIRKVYVWVDEIRREAGQELKRPVGKAAAAVVFSNPYAGSYVQDLSLLSTWSVDLGSMLTQRAVAALGIDPDQVESYGKAAIAGEKGELEQCAALMHPSLGKPMRDNVGGGKAIIPSAKKMGYPGVSIDVPLHYKNAAFVRSHFDAMEVRIPDAPRDDELVLIIAITDNGRPLPRIGGLTLDQVQGEDGLK
jgi:hypothetical protein